MDINEYEIMFYDDGILMSELIEGYNINDAKLNFKRFHKHIQIENIKLFKGIPAKKFKQELGRLK